MPRIRCHRNARASLTDAHAQAFPSKPIRVISAFAAGMGPDVAMRSLADKMSRQLGQPVGIEPRPGGNGFIATNALKQSPADGYTLLLVSNAHLSLNPHLFREVPYNVETDFDPVSTIYHAPFFIATSATSPYQNLAQLLAAAKSEPNRVTYSIPYIGSPPHLGGAFFEHLTGTKILAIPYKDVQVTSSVAAGEIDFTMATLGSFNALLKGGRLKLLAIAQPARLKSEPNVPTVEEAGGPKGLTVESWVGLVAPRGTPPDIVRRLQEEMSRALVAPDLVERYHDAGLVAKSATPAEMASLIRTDGKFYSKLIKQIGMTVE
ncbi:tripartite tricarboxylate transporter substrate binding protein [Polaromonas sp. P1(28)-8]|nr:tripartite tricarboxylate transporter substrate binding protein [Polaromonas sp. P1(28)-8]